MSAVADFFALEDEWSRPAPPVGRADVVTCLVLEVVGIVTLELARSAGAFEGDDTPWWVLFLVLSAGVSPLLWRRRYPLTVALYLAAHMFVTGVTIAALMAQVSLQICYFVGLFSAMAWGRSRRSALLVCSGIILFMLCWVAWEFALGSGIQEFLGDDQAPESGGVLPAIPAFVLLVFAINVVYFFGATVGGQVAWRGARQRAELVRQATHDRRPDRVAAPPRRRRRAAPDRARAA